MLTFSWLWQITKLLLFKQRKKMRSFFFCLFMHVLNSDLWIYHWNRVEKHHQCGWHCRQPHQTFYLFYSGNINLNVVVPRSLSLSLNIKWETEGGHRMLVVIYNTLYFVRLYLATGIVLCALCIQQIMSRIQIGRWLVKFLGYQVCRVLEYKCLISCEKLERKFICGIYIRFKLYSNANGFSI